MEIEDINPDEMADIDLGEFGVVKEPSNDTIALIDADTIAFTAALACEEEVMVLPPSFYSAEEWAEIEANPTFDGEMYYTQNMANAKEYCRDKIQKILDLTGCKDVELHFSSGKSNFRYKIYPSYKANRTDRAPTALKEIKLMLMDEYKSQMHTLWEADDVVVMLKKKFPEKYTLCAIDKDVLMALPGRHFNYFECNYYRGETHVLRDMGFEEIASQDALYWPYIQCIDGDTSDNIKGPHGVGPKSIAKFINGCALPKGVSIKKLPQLLPHLKPGLTHKELWSSVVQAYASKGLTEQDAILNMNLVNMHLLEPSTGFCEQGHQIIVSDDTYQIVDWSPNE